jgi:hypothetical protein
MHMSGEDDSLSEFLKGFGFDEDELACRFRRTLEIEKLGFRR